MTFTIFISTLSIVGVVFGAQLNFPDVNFDFKYNLNNEGCRSDLMVTWDESSPPLSLVYVSPSGVRASAPSSGVGHLVIDGSRQYIQQLTTVTIQFRANVSLLASEFANVGDAHNVTFVSVEGVLSIGYYCVHVSGFGVRCYMNYCRPSGCSHAALMPHTQTEVETWKTITMTYQWPSVDVYFATQLNLGIPGSPPFAAASDHLRVGGGAAYTLWIDDFLMFGEGCSGPSEIQVSSSTCPPTKAPTTSPTSSPLPLPTPAPSLPPLPPPPQPPPSPPPPPPPSTITGTTSSERTRASLATTTATTSANAASSGNRILGMSESYGVVVIIVVASLLFLTVIFVAAICRRRGGGGGATHRRSKRSSSVSSSGGGSRRSRRGTRSSRPTSFAWQAQSPTPFPNNNNNNIYAVATPLAVTMGGGNVYSPATTMGSSQSLYGPAPSNSTNPYTQPTDEGTYGELKIN